MGTAAPTTVPSPPSGASPVADYAHAFLAAPQPLVIVGGSWEIVTANTAACELLGASVSELVGKDLHASMATSGRPLSPDAGPPSALDGQMVIHLRPLQDPTIEDYERRLRHERAIAACATALLRAESVDDLTTALEALVDAAGVETLFVEVNVNHETLGFCSSLIHEVSKPAPVVNHDYWSMVPWSRMPGCYDALSQGDIWILRRDELSPEEADLYAGVTLASEIDAPIYVKGEWAGLVGFADRRRERRWDEGEIRLLRAAAQMFGAVWEKHAARDEMVAAVASAEKRARYEHALFEASRALQSTTNESAIGKAVDALLSATEGSYGFVEHNVFDPVEGWCTEILYSGIMHEDGRIENRIDPYWARVPWSKLPDSFERLSRGEPFVFDLEDLGPVERRTYEGDDTRVFSEVDIPIFVEGEWVGLVGFSDVRATHTWEPADVRLLQTAADMIGAYWARQRAEQRLRKLVESKDEFLAGVSHELRTPLTTVVGLSSELRDRPKDFSDQEREELIGLITAESMEMAGLVADLLVAARDDVDAVAVHPERVDLGAEFESVAHAMVTGSDLVLDLPEDSTAWADPIRVRQILRNLATNADRYGGPKLRFSVTRRGDRVLAILYDDGEPIPESDRDRIFDAYHRAHEPGSQPSAVGLGLTVSRRLARLMGGDLRYRADGGNVFELELPAGPG